MNEVIRKEIVRVLDARIIYPIFEIKWVSLVHYLPKKIMEVFLDAIIIDFFRKSWKSLWMIFLSMELLLMTTFATLIKFCTRVRTLILF